MQIPDHILRGKRSKADKASAVLKYIILTLAVQHTSRASVRSLAKLLEMDHSTVSIYIRRGAFPEATAERIVSKLKHPQLKAEHLAKPLSMLSVPTD